MKKNLSDRLKHAFAYEKPEEFEPSDEDRALIDVVCRAVVERGMATPATLFLESTRPLNYLGSQMMAFFEPVMRAVLRHPEAWERFARILEHRGAIEYLCQRIEALENERRNPDAASKEDVTGSSSPADPDAHETEASSTPDEQ